MDRPDLFELTDWRAWGSVGHAVTAAQVLADLAALPGGVPAALDTDRACLRFAGACGVPLPDADIEPDLMFPHPRWASRAWLRAEYERFHAWCLGHGWLEGTPAPPPAKPKKKKEPAVA